MAGLQIVLVNDVVDAATLVVADVLRMGVRVVLQRVDLEVLLLVELGLVRRALVVGSGVLLHNFLNFVALNLLLLSLNVGCQVATARWVVTVFKFV